MREVRMTFGEHLEELRKRILIALLYVVVGVVVAVFFEKTLMEITLQPHQRAFRNAQKSKLLERLDTQLKELQALEASPGAPGEAAPGFSLTDWQILFRGEVRRQAIIRELSEPFSNFAGELEQLLPSLPEAERLSFEESYRRQGELLAGKVAERFATLGELEPVSEIPRRFRVLEEKLKAL